MDLVAVGPSDEALLLELLNTTPVVDGVPRDDLAEPKAARAWMRERGIAPTEGELAALLEARSTLQNVVRGDARPASCSGSSTRSGCGRPSVPTGWTGGWRRTAAARAPRGRCWPGTPCGSRAPAGCARARTPSAGCS